MTVCNIYHDGDYLGTAINYKAAVKFLVNHNYISGEDEVPCYPYDPNHPTDRLDVVLGEDWFDIMMNEWEPADLNSLWDCWFEVQEVEVIE